MTHEFTIVQHGLDAYGRPVFMTLFMEEWFADYCDELGWVPRILQGAYMEMLGGGASASQGAHDKGMCLDLETAGRTIPEIDRMVRVARERAAGAYRRDRTYRHGSMTPHLHLTLGDDAEGSPMAEILWSSYVSGGDGLGIQPPQPDYEWRPDPLVLHVPEEDVSPDQEDRIVQRVADKVVKALTEGKPNGSELTRDQLLKQARGAAVEARDLLKQP